MSNIEIEPMKQAGRIINYWKKEKFIVFCIVVFGISCNTLVVFGPIYQGKLIDAILHKESLNSLVILAFTFVGIVLFVQMLRYFKRYYIRRFANINIATMRMMIFNNIMHKSLTELDEENIGNLMTRTISDVDLCVEGMRKFSTEVFDTGVMMLAYFISLLIYDFKITALAVLFIPLAMFLAEKLKSIIYKYSIKFRKKSSEIADIILDAVDHSMLYRISGMEIKNSRRFDADLIDLQNKAVKANVLENSMQPVYKVIAMFGIVSVIYLGGMKVIGGGWTVGVFSTYVVMFIAMALNASKAARLFNSVQKSKISWQRIKPYLSEYVEKPPFEEKKRISTRLVLDKVSFAYHEDSPSIIENITLHASSGEIIGITGPIASGKSTLGIALLGLYPYQGSIKINDVELRDLPESERSGRIAYLGHKPQLLSDSIYNNITLGQSKDISRVLQDVCFEKDLETMPERENTLVGNAGIRLSGGQQARIALARALASDREILILDDPFSAVDMTTEAKIIANLKAHYADRCIFLISHRLAIFNQIDRILLLYGEKSNMFGTHEELMQESALYERIYTLQHSERGDTDEK
ncbi:MAG: ABC transporter ATP-binding protein [Erysipelotrichales bacterium]|nr:MAG: ABC transporter ATP-binding protein [Erysipelotrichales bacterium]